MHRSCGRAYVARMEDVLDLYAEDPDPKRPVVCFDESPTQLIGETRLPIPPEPGRPERYDCEYKRNGTANMFVFVDAHKSWRHVKVTDHRAARDFAHCMRDLADTHYPDADRIRVAMDNLSTHSVGALDEIFPAPEAHRLLHRLEFHYTPKHASWLNMVEIESACCAANVSTAASASAVGSKPRSHIGSADETPRELKSNGGSQRKKRVKNSPASIQSSPKNNLCDEVLVSTEPSFETPACGLLRACEFFTCLSFV